MSDPYGNSYCDLRGEVTDTGDCDCLYLNRWVGCRGLDEYCCLAKSTEKKLKEMIWADYKQNIKNKISAGEWSCPMDDLMAWREESGER